VHGLEILALLASAVLVVIAAFLAMAETALTHVPRAKAVALRDDGRRGAPALLEALEHREQVLTPVLLLVLACHVTAATLVALVASNHLGGAGAAGVVVLEVIVLFVVAEAAPKTFALGHPERAALLVAPGAALLGRLWPVRVASQALVALTNLVMPGQKRSQGPIVSEEELLAFVHVAAQEAVIETEERALIESIIDFGDTVAREVMVPRTDMVTVQSTFRIADAMEVVLLNGYSRIPVTGTEGIDDVRGLLYAKDLMRAERDGHSGDHPVESLIRRARFVPETKRIAELLREMQAEQFHMAIVVDEYGATAGLVTLEDLIEELVGEIVDEFDVEDPIIEPLPGGDVRVNARMTIDELNDLIHAQLPTGDWDTVAGLVFDRLGHVPTQGEEVEVDGHRIRVERVQGRRIARVRIAPLAPPDDAGAAAPADAEPSPEVPAMVEERP
jgi:CBS domain containing-hemolysin-like protein